jgi:guanylate cyclase
VSIVISSLAFIWVITFFAVGRPLAASIPLVYQLASVGSLVVFARTKRFRLLRFHQLAMMSVFPFILQWSLGGYVQGSAVSLWSVTTPALAFMFGARAAPWFVSFATLTIASGVADDWLRDQVSSLGAGFITSFFVLNVLGAGLSFFLGLQYFNRERERARAALAAEQEKSESLLLNILPEPIAERLKEGEQVIADAHEVSVLFLDIVDFTATTAAMEPAAVVEALNEVFSDLDDLTDRFGLEKIKTLGDGYVAVAGAPVERRDHAEAVADFALAVRDEISGRPFGARALQLRIGIDTGQVVAAVIGKRKFSYDMWGDVVNTASRMESHGVPDRIQVTEHVFEALRDRYVFEDRGTIDVKGKGLMRTYFLEGRKPNR